MTRIVRGLAALALLGGAGVATSASAQAAPYCGITWGSQPKVVSGGSYGHIEDLRAGRHGCFDRLVIDLDHDAEGYQVRYGALESLGSGDDISLEGAADLVILVEAPAYDDDGQATYDPADHEEAVDVDGYRTFRQVYWDASFEGQTQIGLGVRARLPMRVFVLDGPGDGSRIVVDVAHRW